jgi:hypothetical protein
VLSGVAGGSDLKVRGHPDERGYRVGVHFLEHPMAVNLGRLLGDTEIESDLFVELAANEMGEHLAFSRRETIVSGAEPIQMLALFPCFSIPQQCRGDCIQQTLSVGRLRQEINRTILHRLHGVSDIGVPGHKNDRKTFLGLGQATLNVQAAQPG